MRGEKQVGENKVILFFPDNGVQEMPRVPYALLYLERAVRDLDIEIIFIDENLEKDYFSATRPVPDNILLAGVSVMLGEQIESCVHFSKYIKSVSKAPIVWGGWYPSQLPEQVLKEEYIDMVVIGQGEMPFRNLLLSLLHNKHLSEVKGLGFKENGNILINSPGIITEPSALPEVNYTLIDIKKYYYRPEHTFGYNITTGCPFNCGFCSTALIFKHKWIHKSIDEVIKDLLYFKNTLLDVSQITFEDDNFFADRQFVMDLVQAFMDNHLEIKWSASAHASLFLKLFSEEDVETIKQSGCTGIYIGAESGDQDVLDLISKKATVADNLSFVKILTRHNILPSFSTMMFFPVNPRRDMMKTIQMIVQAHLLNPSFFSSVNYYNPCPNTPLFELASKQGFKFPENNEDLITLLKKGIDLPWVKKKYIRMLLFLKYFYFPFSDRDYYKTFKGKVPLKYILYYIFLQIIKLRTSLGYFRFPVEAALYCFFLPERKELIKGLFDEKSSFKKIILP